MNHELILRGSEDFSIPGKSSGRIKRIIESAQDISFVREEALSADMLVRDEEARRELLRDPDNTKNTYLQGLILSIVPDSSISSEIRRKLKIASRRDVVADPIIHHPSWYLCETSEDRMRESIEEHATVVIGGLMVKLRGKMTALCFESFATDCGTFVKGNFYSPDKKVQEVIRESFAEGENKPDVAGRWILMRGIRTVGGYSELLDECAQEKANFPSEIPARINGVARSVYYDKYHEIYSNQE